MLDFHFERRGRLAIGTAVAAAALALAACGGGGDDGGSTTPPVVTTPSPGPVGDSFLVVVNYLVASVSDTTEPVAITDVTATTPETTEPEPIP